MNCAYNFTQIFGRLRRGNKDFCLVMEKVTLQLKAPHMAVDKKKWLRWL